MKKVTFAFFAVATILTSCATIFTGTRDTISFNSTPSGATIYKDGIELCKTPCTVPLKRKLGESSVEFKLDGYETRLIILDKTFNPVSIINLGSIFGWGIDALTGSIVKYDRKSYDIKLSKDRTTRVDLKEIKPSEVRINSQTKVIELIVKK